MNRSDRSKSNVSELYRVALKAECSRKSHDGDLGTILERVLKTWEKLAFVSFATAFKFWQQAPRRGEVVPFNGLTYDGTDAKKISYYACFRRLTRSTVNNCGRLPWDILRSGIKSETGVFQPQLIAITSGKAEKVLTTPVLRRLRNELNRHSFEFPLVTVTSEDPDSIIKADIRKDFEHLSDVKQSDLQSWKWYAAYPTILAEDVRRAPDSPNKSTKLLVYMLGTRKEFARNSPFDYGLIMGLTDTLLRTGELGELIEAIEAVLGGWNFLVVPHYIIEREQRLRRFEEGRHVVHTVGSFIDTEIEPYVKVIATTYIADQQTQKDVLELFQQVKALPKLMSFVTRRPLNDGEELRERDDVESEAYDLVNHLDTEIREALQFHGFLDIVSNPNHFYIAPFRWVKKFVLEAALSELYANLKNYADKSKEVGIRYSSRKHGGDDYLVVRVSSFCAPGTVPTNKREAGAIHGLASLDAFFKALGGRACGFTMGRRQKYVTRMEFNLTRWRQAVSVLRES